jgi:hypothetical protein
MELKFLMRQAAITVLGFAALLPVTAVAQEIRSEVSAQGTGFLTKNSKGNGIRERATETGGVLFAYRYNLNPWLAAEVNYGHGRNTQIYSGTTPARVQANLNQFTGAAVVKLPALPDCNRMRWEEEAVWFLVRPETPAALSRARHRRPEAHSSMALVLTTL